jgi:hypothetical protein
MVRWLTTIVFVLATMLGTAAPAAAAQLPGELCPKTAFFPFVVPTTGGLVPGAITTVEQGHLPLCVGTFIITIDNITVGSGGLLALHQPTSVTAYFAGALSPVDVPPVGVIAGAFFGKLTFQGTPVSGAGTLRVTFCGAGSCHTVIATFAAAGGVFTLTGVTVLG